MKILHIASSDIKGGAAKGAYALHRSLLEEGVDSQMLVLRKFSDDETVHCLSPRLLNTYHRASDLIDQWFLKLYRKRSLEYFSPAFTPSFVFGAIDKIGPDVLHFHWVNGGFLTPESISSLKIPVVWTLRDEWPYTGGCHYAYDCSGFMENCSNCPVLGKKSLLDYSTKLLARKIRMNELSLIQPVGLSKWISDRAQRSKVFEGELIPVIPNSVDIGVFFPSAKIREFVPGEFTLIFGAINATTDARKGYHYILKALAYLIEITDSVCLHVLVFGAESGEIVESDRLRFSFVGHVDALSELADMYRNADLALVPSVLESFGKTALEAMACGTPVVAFDTSGLRDIVAHLETGFLARPYCEKKIAEGILYFLSDPGILREASLNSVKRVKECYTPQLIANRYIEVYKRQLNWGDDSL